MQLLYLINNISYIKINTNQFYIIIFCLGLILLYKYELILNDIRVSP